MKLGVLWDFFSTPRCPNRLQFVRIQNEGPDVPKNFICLPSDSFLIRAAADENLKLSWILVFQKISLTFNFFLLSPAFSIDFNCYEQLLEKAKSFVFYFEWPWTNFSIVIPRSNKKNWVFLQTFESNGSFFTNRNSELDLDFATRWERNKDLPEKSSERVELYFFVKIQEIFENKCLPQKYTFRKKTRGHVYFGSNNAA